MKTQSTAKPTFNRRELLIGAGGILAAATLTSASAAEGGSLDFIYTSGVVWNPALPGLTGKLRLNVYAAILSNGKGTGTMSDALHPEFASHIRFIQMDRSGNKYEFRGEISDSNTGALVGERLDIVALVNGEATILNVRLLGAVFPGLGRFTNLRANANGSFGLQFPGQL